MPTGRSHPQPNSKYPDPTRSKYEYLEYPKKIRIQIPEINMCYFIKSLDK